MKYKEMLKYTALPTGPGQILALVLELPRVHLLHLSLMDLFYRERTSSDLSGVSNAIEVTQFMEVLKSIA